MIFNGPIGEFLIAIALLIAGIALVGCGVNVCWLRFKRNKSNLSCPIAATRALSF